MPDSQPAAGKRIRKPTQKVVEATQEEVMQSLHELVIWLKESQKWQNETIKARKKEIAALRELPKMIQNLQRDIEDLKAAETKLHEETRKAITEHTTQGVQSSKVQSNHHMLLSPASHPTPRVSYQYPHRRAVHHHHHSLMSLSALSTLPMSVNRIRVKPPPVHSGTPLRKN